MLVYREIYFCSILCNINQTVLGRNDVAGNEIMCSKDKGRSTRYMNENYFIYEVNFNLIFLINFRETLFS